jgi:HEPN domain-containing protein
MPPTRDESDPREWLNRARSNLELGRVARPGIYLEDICFDAQQAAEKAIKAVFVHRGWRFPYIHDLGRLLDLLEEHGEKVPAAVRDSDQLSLYAFATRYPGGPEPVAPEDHRRAVSIAETVVAWAESVILGTAPAAGP